MRVLWVKAPFVLRRHPPLLAALIVVTALAALAAAASPLVRTGVESESLHSQLERMSPLAAGLEIRVHGEIAGNAARAEAAKRLARTLPYVGTPVVSTNLRLRITAGGSDSSPVLALARTEALEHVVRETPRADGVWIASSTAGELHVRPGDTIVVPQVEPGGHTPALRLRVAGIYRPLVLYPDNPYWANWLQDIRNPDPNFPPPPPFMLMPGRTIARVAKAVDPFVENRFELPVDPGRLTLTRAKTLERRLDEVRAQLARPRSRLARPLGCTAGGCVTGSSLASALTIATGAVAAVSPTISLLAGLGVLLALGLSTATGVFLVRRRGDEAHVLFARGEPVTLFGLRTALEALLPALVGAGLGLGAALLGLHVFASGAVDGGTVTAAVLRAVAATGAAVVAVAVGAAAAFPRAARPRRSLGLVLRVPWELAPLAVAGALLGLVVAGHGLATDATGASHPQLSVFVLPLVAVGGAAGLAARGSRRLLRDRGRGAPPAVFLAVRRIGAARGLLIAVAIAAAAGFGAFCYAATLSASLDRTTAEKAWVANGSDVQGVVDPGDTVPANLPFPVALVEIDEENVTTPAGEPVDLIAGDPQALAKTLRWGDGWDDDPRPLLPSLERSTDTPLAAIATPGAPVTDAIVDQGMTIPVHVVGHAALPGSTAGRPALLVSRAALRRLARRHDFFDPAPQATGFVWAKGPAHVVEPRLAASTLRPAWLTTPAHILEDPSVAAARRSYRFVKLIGAAAAVLSLVALLLYLQARQRSQSIASALVRRMGLRGVADGAALALEAAVIVLFSGVVGGAVATAAASPIARHVDPLPQYAPGAAFSIPWATLLAGLGAAVAAGAVLGAAAAAIATRADVSEALRVA